MGDKSLWCKQCTGLKRRSTLTRIHGSISQKAFIILFNVSLYSLNTEHCFTFKLAVLMKSVFYEICRFFLRKLIKSGTKFIKIKGLHRSVMYRKKIRRTNSSADSLRNTKFHRNPSSRFAQEIRGQASSHISSCGYSVHLSKCHTKCQAVIERHVVVVSSRPTALYFGG
jgi:hypothetical protein